MYEKDGEKYYVVDSHIHFWNGGASNQKNRYGAGFTGCFYDYQKNLSPSEWVWDLEKFGSYTEDDLLHDLFDVGYVDKGIFQPTYLTDFYTEGFNTTERNGALAEKHPSRLITNGAWDPRDGEAGLDALEALHERWNLKGVKLYTAEWKGDSKGWKLTDPWSYRYLEKCEALGIRNIHVHKGPTIYPLNRDAFDVADVDEVATAFPNLNFIIEHVGLPRLEDFCWIATQEPNVYGGLAVAMPFIYSRPRYFAQIIGELLYWLDGNRLTFASDYAIWQPKWLVEMFVDFQIPEDMQGEYGVLTTEVKKKILGLNAARLYGFEVPAEARITTPGPTTGESIGSAPVDETHPVTA
ncbi:amidohydrolase family protein [Kineosporia succinea]|uniref:TIM-barrel fold metal-dependent hydrolase n=1 Tax=Kineosporia succinea TaxID=84632 RepID=A0ABT9P4Z3_9ACTN|nr:amidohydrolase family protein [Kineosporia succinea]MDP9827748.1 putative TIM-barrel fold metal-dependent hydrolase [Kineosporia succinea]